MDGQKRRIRWSKTGLCLATLYASAAAILFHNAMTCTGWVCDFVAFPVFLPAGEIYWWPFSGKLDYVPDPMRRWEFVIPAAITNIVIYYGVGSLIGGGFRRLFQRRRA